MQDQFKQHNEKDTERKIFHRHIFQYWWVRALTVLCSIVVFCTVYMLILPASAVSVDDATPEEGFYLEASPDETIPDQVLADGTAETFAVDEDDAFAAGVSGSDEGASMDINVDGEDIYAQEGDPFMGNENVEEAEEIEEDQEDLTDEPFTEPEEEAALPEEEIIDIEIDGEDSVVTEEYPFRELICSASGFDLAMIFSKDLNIPETANLDLSEVQPETDAFNAKYEAAAAAVAAQGQAVSAVRFFNISLYDGGKEIQLPESIHFEIRYHGVQRPGQGRRPQVIRLNSERNEYTYCNTEVITENNYETEDDSQEQVAPETYTTVGFETDVTGLFAFAEIGQKEAEAATGSAELSESEVSEEESSEKETDALEESDSEVPKKDSSEEKAADPEESDSEVSKEETEAIEETDSKVSEEETEALEETDSEVSEVDSSEEETEALKETDSEASEEETESTEETDEDNTAKELVYTDEEFDLAVIFDENISIPATAELQLIDQVLENVEFKAAYAKTTAEAAAANKAVSAIRFFTLKIMDGEEEIALPENVSFEIRYHEDTAPAEDRELEVAALENGLFAFITTEESAAGQLTASEENSYNITMDYDAGAGIPFDAYLSVREILPGTDEYNSYLDGAQTAVEDNESTTGEVSYARFFDITILNAAGQEITPAAPVAVNITFPEKEAIELSDSGSAVEEVLAVHFDEENDNIDLIETETNGTESFVSDVSFEAGTFSVYGVIYTVDFNYVVNGGTYEFSIPGGGFVTLHQLVEVLGISDDGANNARTEGSDSAAEEQSGNNIASYLDIEISDKTREFVADVESVEFSNPSLVWVGKVDESSTVGGLKEANGLDVEYSAELTEEQIAEINAQTVESGDWALISVQPFTSEESLTVTMKNGESFTVMVMDAQLTTHALTADGTDFVITVTYGPEAEIPDGAELVAEEIVEGSEKYDFYYNQALNQISQEEEKEAYSAGLLFARFFDVSIIEDGIIIEPAAPVEVKIKYADPIPMSEDDQLKVVHFAENGIELIDIETSDAPTSDIVYEQSSFSVIGTVTVANNYGWPAEIENPYVLLLQDGEDYYAVAHDGALKKVYYLHGTVSFMGEGATNLDYLNNYLWDYSVVSNSNHTATISTHGTGTPQYIYPYYGLLPQNAATPDAVIGPGQRTLNISNGKVYATYYGERYTISAEGGALHRTTLESDDASPVSFARLSSFTANSSESELYDFIDVDNLVEIWKEEMSQDLVVDKTAEVYDYENRIYQVDLMASSGYRLITPALAMEFVVDASRSMYFPENLYRVQNNNGSDYTYTNAQGLRNFFSSGLANRNEVYYFITDMENAATNYAVFYHDAENMNPLGDGTNLASGWYYVDASLYYPPDSATQTGEYPEGSGYCRNITDSRLGNLTLNDGYIYTAPEKVSGMPWTRLDYLRIAVEAAARVLFAVDPEAQIGLVSFNSETHTYGPFTASHLNELIADLYNIDLKGGTKHADGLNKAYDEFTNHFVNVRNCQTTAILITDGSPNGNTWEEINTAARRVKNITNNFGQATKLYTLGLSLPNIGTNRQKLAAIATDTSCSFNAEKSTEVVDCITKIIEAITINANLRGNVVDIIDPAFYPVNPKTGMPLENGTWITVEGQVTSAGGTNAVGRVIYDESKGWKVEWSSQIIDWPERVNDKTGEILTHGWNGRIFVKAIEDFLGGNDISTNADGSKAEALKYVNPKTGQEIDIPNTDTEREEDFKTPFVNVDELHFDENSTEWTVYLGTSVDPKTELEVLFDAINVYEVVKDDGNLVYTLTPGSTVNPGEKSEEGKTFKLSSVTGEIDWERLIGSETHTLEYEYSKYGHTPGTITISLTQNVVEGEDNLTGSPHNTAVVGSKVEEYTLNIQYTPFPASILNYHTGNNVTGSHGSDTDEIESENTHIINVIDKSIQIEKVDANGNPITTGEAAFKLYKTDSEGSTVDGLPEGKYTEVSELTTTAATGLSAEEVLYPDVNDDNAVISTYTTGSKTYKRYYVDNTEYYLLETSAPASYTKYDQPVKVTLGLAETKTPVIVDSNNNVLAYNWDQTATVTIDDTSDFVTVDASGKPIKISIRNDRPAELEIIKTDNADTPNEIGGAVFTLTKDRVLLTDLTIKDKNGNAVTVDATTGRFTIPKGGVTVEDLSGGDYVLSEVEPPQGYIKTIQDIVFEVDWTGKITDVANELNEKLVEFVEASETYKIKNESGAALPNTGGPGTTLFYLIGCILTMLAGAGIVMKRRRREAA